MPVSNFLQYVSLVENPDKIIQRTLARKICQNWCAICPSSLSNLDRFNFNHVLFLCNFLNIFYKVIRTNRAPMHGGSFL